MNKFFVPNKVYEDRIAICKACDKYLSLLGNCSICKCFMKLKARLAPSECPATPKKWEKTREKIKEPKELPIEIIESILNVASKFIRGKFKDHKNKKDAIELYNTIYMTNYSTTTNCSSCLNDCYRGINKLYEKYTKKNND